VGCVKSTPLEIVVFWDVTRFMHPTRRLRPESLKHTHRDRSGFGTLQPPYAAAVQALLENGPMQGKAVEVEPVEGRPPKTIDVPDEKGGTCRYCLAQWTQEGMTAVYTFLYAV
jgi:hypothetical protein